MADTTNAVPESPAHLQRDCYLSNGHSGHDLLAPGTCCPACGFEAPTDGELTDDTAELASLRSRCEILAMAARLNGETISGMQVHARNVEAERDQLKFDRDHLAASLRGLLKQMDDEESNRESGIFADPGCRVCTHGVTPDRYHTGPCARHRAIELLHRLGMRGAV